MISLAFYGQAFYIPCLRQIWTWLGFSSVTEKNLISLLVAGDSCIIVPGGMRETLFMEHGCEVHYLSNASLTLSTKFQLKNG